MFLVEFHSWTNFIRPSLLHIQYTSQTSDSFKYFKNSISSFYLIEVHNLGPGLQIPIQEMIKRLSFGIPEYENLQINAQYVDAA
jgi:hypothetical protein